MVAEFIDGVFHDLPDGTRVLVGAIAGDPRQAHGYPVRPWPDAAARLREDTNNFVALGSYRPDESGELRRRKGQCAAVHALLLDDLGTKCSMERLNGLQVSWLLETSPQNYQAGFIFRKPVDPSTAEVWNQALIEAGLCGPSTRLCRLPLGINGKAEHRAADGSPFRVRMVEWRPTALHDRGDRAGAGTRPDAKHAKDSRCATS